MMYALTLIVYVYAIAIIDVKVGWPWSVTTPITIGLTLIIWRMIL